MKRIWHRYETWEDYQNGMWHLLGKDEEEEFLNSAIIFTGNAELYGSYMMEVIKQWPISCEYNFTCDGLNKQAWVGHAACCIALNCPEYITRQAWRFLTEQQQIDANIQADNAIKKWENENLKLMS